VAFVKTTGARRASWARPRPRALDPYSAIAARWPSQEIDVNYPRARQPFPIMPAGSLAAAVANLGDLGDGTGIDFIDTNLTAIRQQVDAAALAAKITAACSIAGAMVSLLLLVKR
jgi:hypothetical protein